MEPHIFGPPSLAGIAGLVNKPHDFSRVWCPGEQLLGDLLLPSARTQPFFLKC